jgi:sterol desaturase/sphingolipid hydroxylase (fatty acid hydroxylase superfamily)
MISKRSFLNFLYHNFFFYTYGFCDYFIYTFILEQKLKEELFIKILLSFLLSSFRNFFLYFLLFHNIQKYDSIYSNQLPIPIDDHDFRNKLPSIFLISLLDGINILLIYSFCNFIIPNHIFNDFMYDLLYFIPKSFFIEIIFDFFHYWAHRIEHNIPLLYKHFHKIHHQHNHPTLLSTFHHHIGDLILSNTIPLFLSLYICSYFFRITHYMFHMIFLSKIYIELCGHSGKKIKTGSFVQCIWLPKIFGISLYTIDHDNHHTMNNCNYGKRFSLWDKVYKTFYQDKIEK